MINGAHVIVYSPDAEADRAFIRDTLEFPGVDAGGGWTIFQLPPSEVAVHPTEGASTHELFLMCDDLERTLTDLSAKGVERGRAITDEGWGRLASIMLPSGAEQPLYYPRHPVAHARPE